MLISVSDDITYRFKPLDVPFLRLPDITAANNYCVAEFRKGHRIRDNIIRMSQLVMYDFDDGYPLSDVLERMQSLSITALAVTSKSHRKEKGDKAACDRYRLLIPLSEAVELPFGEYQLFYDYLSALIGIKPYVDKTKDPTRMFFGNPSQETHFVLTGRVLDFKILKANFRAVAEVHKQEENKKRIKIKAAVAERRESGELFENELPRNTPIETRRGVFMFEDFEYLDSKTTVPCRCVSPVHEDRNPSAFVGRSNSGNLMVRCVSCGYLAFIGGK